MEMYDVAYISHQVVDSYVLAGCAPLPHVAGRVQGIYTTGTYSGAKQSICSGRPWLKFAATKRSN